MFWDGERWLSDTGVPPAAPRRAKRRTPAAWISTGIMALAVIALLVPFAGASARTGRAQVAAWAEESSVKVVQETSTAITFRGTWTKAYYDTYMGGGVRASNSAGDTASIRFKGAGIAWVGPMGPTRGTAKVYLDGTLVKTVSTYDDTFRPQQVLFSRTFASVGWHKVVINVSGTDGHPTVAVDAFIVRLTVPAPDEAPTEPPSDPTPAPTAEPTTEPTAPPTADPTAAPTTEPTAPPTADPTAAPTVAPTTAPTVAPSVAPTAAPTATPAPAPQALTFGPTTDIGPTEQFPTVSNATVASIRVDEGVNTDYELYAAFNVTGVSGTVTGARLRVYSTVGTTNGPKVYRTGAITSSTTWATRPAKLSGALADVGTVAAGSWTEYDVKAAVTGNGVVTFGLVPDYWDDQHINAMEASANRPQLIVTTNGATVTPLPTPAPTPAPTATPVPAPTATPAPGSTTLPTGDLPGWRMIFNDDFNTAVAKGGWSASSYSTRWGTYPSTWRDSSGNGTYSPDIISVANGIWDAHIQTVNGVHKVAAIVPKVAGNGEDDQLYGRYAVRFRADSMRGYKGAWLLWPQTNTWPRDGEIDFPEGDFDGRISAYMHKQGATSGSDQDAFSTSATWTTWHTAVTEWTPTSVKFYLDGVLIGTSTSRIPNTPMHWVIQNETTLSGFEPDDAVQGHVQVDWVAAWAYNP